MADETTAELPGRMTVPVLFGWELILTGLVVLVVLGLLFVVIATSRAGTGERSEWQAYLDARSSRPTSTDAHDGSVGGARPTSGR